MKKKSLKGSSVNVEDTLNKSSVNIHKNTDIFLDRNTMENIDEERYPTQAKKKEFEVSLHFSEEVRGILDIDGEWIKILKDTYIMQFMEERKRKRIGEGIKEEEKRSNIKP